MNDEKYAIRMPSELRRKLEAVATKEDRSLADIIRRMLEKALGGKK